MAAQHPHNLARRGARYLADADFLASVFGLKHRETEDTDNGENQANNSDEVGLTEEAELIVVGLLEHLVKGIHLVIGRSAIMLYQFVGLLANSRFIGIICDAHQDVLVEWVIGFVDDKENLVAIDAHGAIVNIVAHSNDCGTVARFLIDSDRYGSA